MPASRTAPLCQIRVIGTATDAATLIHRLVEHATRLFGPDITCRTQTRAARRLDHVRAYLTITRKEPPDDQHHR